jgi:peptidoglycan/xylan/chitin deacetylase (PgdA/CDA1 family)
MRATSDSALLMPVALPRSLRPLGLGIVIVGHGLAAVAAFAGVWWLALAALAPAAFCVVWGTFNPHSRLFGAVLSRLHTDERVVWLTFDDGPGADTPSVLDVLERHRARATFFLVGKRARANAACVRAIVAAGHQIGNHSQAHAAAWFWGLSPGRLAREIGGAQDTLWQLAGVAPQWFRAVAGHANPFLDPVLRAHGLSRASWRARGFDSVDDDDARVLRRLVRRIAPGTVLMLHEDARRPGRCARLTDALLLELAARGYRTVLPVPLPSQSAAARSSPASALSVSVSPQSASTIR